MSSDRGPCRDYGERRRRLRERVEREGGGRREKERRKETERGER